MIDFGVLCTYKKYEGWKNWKPRKVEGYGAISGTPIYCECKGVLVSLVNDEEVQYLFIADEQLLDEEFPVDGDPYLLHSGIFNDKRAQGRCWFVDYVDEKDGIIYTSSKGMFHMKHEVGGVLV